jgi:hypothetical protein
MGIKIGTVIQPPKAKYTTRRTKPIITASIPKTMTAGAATESPMPISVGIPVMGNVTTQIETQTTQQATPQKINKPIKPSTVTST